ncbi:MAG: flagellar filament capping protein FliD [Oscillospiraceae bacterium]|nr:flagellar filament capping protein FliD [Oscillospiraceae bacterium]
MTINNMTAAYLSGKPITMPWGNLTSTATTQKPSASAPMNLGFRWRNAVNPAFTNEDIRNAGLALQSTLQSLQPNRSVAQFQGVTDNDSVATANVNSSSALTTSLRALSTRPIEIEVSQTALSQANAGSALDAGDVFGQGAFSFAIESGGKTHNFQINVGADATNESVQRQMAEAINSRKIGITASVSTVAATGTTAKTSALTLTGNATGTNAAFAVSDTSGGLAAAMGIDNATRQSQNAVYRVDGSSERTSQSNNIFLAAGVSANLQGAGTARISIEGDTRAAVSSVTNFVDTLNRALKSASEAGGGGSQRFIADIKAMNRNFGSTLARVGIGLSANGEMSIRNMATLQKAAQDGSLERLFSDRNGGFGARIAKIANDAARTGLYADSPPLYGFDGGQVVFPTMVNMGWLFDFKT